VLADALPGADYVLIVSMSKALRLREEERGPLFLLRQVRYVH
jgi:hypothetical protein